MWAVTWLGGEIVQHLEGLDGEDNESNRSPAEGSGKAWAAEHNSEKPSLRKHLTIRLAWVSWQFLKT